MGKERYKLTVEPITCVHIGTGERLTPLDYKIALSKTGRRLYVTFSSDSVIKKITNDSQKFSEFDKLSSLGDMKGMAAFFHKNSSNDDMNYMCHCTKEFIRVYEANKEKDPLQNAAEVFQMYRPEGGRSPVIPGSSLKGSIRTAFLNGELKKSFEKYELRRFVTERGEKEQQIQKELLKFTDAKNDPFRALQIGDCIFEGKGTQCVGMIKNVKYDSQKQETIPYNSSQVLSEVIKGYFMENDTEINLCGESSFVINSDLSDVRLPQKAVSKKIAMQDIIKACNDFYLTEFENEYRKHYKEATNSECDAITNLYKELKSIATKSASNEFIIRVGRWSQVEFVTYENDLRYPRTPSKKGRKMPYGTTRWVFNNDGQYLPLGWCKCKLTPMEK
jgi:CRISPR-associated protein Csm5